MDLTSINTQICVPEAEIKEIKTFYRVGHQETQQGLWYSFGGDFTGYIHDRLSFCKNRDLPMDFDPEIVGFVSAVETLEQLYHWFTREDILRLQVQGWYIHEYRSRDYKWYDRFSHHVVRQSSLTDGMRITLQEITA